MVPRRGSALREDRMSNVTVLPTAAAAPVINRRRGRLPASVAKLACTSPTAALAVKPTGGATRTYYDRRQEAVALVLQGTDAALFLHLEEIQDAVLSLNRRVWEAMNALLYRADPGLEEAGKAKGGLS